MAKVRVSELAKKMGIAQQDLVFKLRSIGVRLEGEDETIDTEIIAAILTGKKLPHQPREVILRDAESTAKAPAPVRRAAAAPHSGQSTAPAAPPHHHPEGRAAHPRHPHARAHARRDRPPPPAPTSRVEHGAGRRPADGGVSKRSRSLRSRSTSTAAAHARPEVAARSTAPRIMVRDPVRPRADSARGPPHRRPPREVIIEEDEGAASARRRRRKERDDGEATVRAPSGPVMVSEGMTVREFAEKLGVLAKDLIQRLMKRGMMASINHVLDVKTATELATDLGVEIMQVSFEEEVQLEKELEQPNRQRRPQAARAGRDRHGPRRPRQDLAARPHPPDARRGRRVGRHHPAHRRLPRDHQRPQHRVPRHAGPRGVHQAARPRRQGDRHRRPGGRGRRQRDGADDRGDQPRQGRRRRRWWWRSTRSTSPTPTSTASSATSPTTASCSRSGAATSPRRRCRRSRDQGVDELLELILLTADLLELKADPDLAGAGASCSRRARNPAAAASPPSWSRTARCASATCSSPARPGARCAR